MKYVVFVHKYNDNTISERNMCLFFRQDLVDKNVRTFLEKVCNLFVKNFLMVFYYGE